MNNVRANTGPISFAPPATVVPSKAAGASSGSNLTNVRVASTTLQTLKLLDRAPVVVTGINFTTREASWQTSQTISEGGRPHFCSPSISSSGDKFAAVWRHENDTLALRRYAPRTGWSDVALLVTTTRSFLSDPQVFLDEAGTAHVLYNNNLELLELSRHTMGSGWSPVEQVVTDGSGRIATWQGGRDAAGHIMVVWSSVTAENNCDVWANLYVPGSGWGAPVQLNYADRVAVQPKLAINAAGDAMAIWQEGEYNSDSYDQLWSRRYTPGSGWEAAQRVDGGSTTSPEDAQIALDDLGNAVAVYTSSGNVMANSHERIAGWGMPSALQCIAGFCFEPQIAFDRHGGAFVSWIQSGARTAHEIYRSRHFGNGWGAAELIAGAAQEYQDHRFAVDNRGSEMFLVTDVTAISSSILAIRNIPGRGWARQVLDVRYDAISRSKTQLAVDGFGGALSIWLGIYSDTTTVEASVFE